MEDKKYPVPEDGAFVHGLFMEGARWCRNIKEIEESHPKVLFDIMPRIWLRPCKREDLPNNPSYECPGTFLEFSLVLSKYSLVSIF